jgi:hypothetical protein
MRDYEDDVEEVDPFLESLKYSATNHWFVKISQEIIRPFRCGNCNYKTNIWNSLGAHECKSHPGSLTGASWNYYLSKEEKIDRVLEFQQTSRRTSCGEPIEAWCGTRFKWSCCGKQNIDKGSLDVGILRSTYENPNYPKGCRTSDHWSSIHGASHSGGYSSNQRVELPFALYYLMLESRRENSSTYNTSLEAVDEIVLKEPIKKNPGRGFYNWLSSLDTPPDILINTHNNTNDDDDDDEGHSYLPHRRSVSYDAYAVQEYMEMTSDDREPVQQLRKMKDDIENQIRNPERVIVNYNTLTYNEKKRLLGAGLFYSKSLRMYLQIRDIYVLIKRMN